MSAPTPTCGRPNSAHRSTAGHWLFSGQSEFTDSAQTRLSLRSLDLDRIADWWAGTCCSSTWPTLYRHHRLVNDRANEIRMSALRERQGRWVQTRIIWPKDSVGSSPRAMCPSDKINFNWFVSLSLSFEFDCLLLSCFENGAIEPRLLIFLRSSWCVRFDGSGDRLIAMCIVRPNVRSNITWLHYW